MRREASPWAVILRVAVAAIGVAALASGIRFHVGSARRGREVRAAAEAAHKNEPSPPGGWFLDLRDHPRFVFQEESLKGKLGAALPYWGILVLFNVVFFVTAFARFMRYDVR
jgi:hypothetical protein